MLKENKKILPIKIYRNNISGNCLIACYLMILNYFKGYSNLKEREKILYSEFKKDFNTLELLKLFYSENISVEIYSKYDYKNFKSKNKKLNDFIKKYLHYINKKKIKNNTGVSLNKEIIKNCIDRNSPIIINCVKNKHPHSIIIHGYDENIFYLADPANKESQNINFSKLKQISNPPMGFWMIALSYQNERNK